jgi:hypothetical protein
VKIQETGVYEISFQITLKNTGTSEVVTKVGASSNTTSANNIVETEVQSSIGVNKTITLNGTRLLNIEASTSNNYNVYLTVSGMSSYTVYNPSLIVKRMY